MTDHDGCFYCGETTDLRPYGPGGAPLCFPCMKATPEREEAARQAFGAVLAATVAISPNGVVAIGGGVDGPVPFNPDHPARNPDHRRHQ